MAITMNREEVTATLRRLAAEAACVNLAEVHFDTDLVHDLNFDSLMKVEYVMTIEDTFEVSIPDEQADNVKTIRDAVDLLMSHLPESQN